MGLPIVSRARPDRPKLWIVAGPNGSGKSSVYTDTDIEDFGGSVWIINPDLLTARIATVERLRQRAANIAAVTRIYAWLEASIAAYQTIGVETVLSTGKYRELVLQARRNGFEIRLIYVLLRSVDLNIERVKLRAAKGGHHVPATKIRARRLRSLDQLPWFLRHADRAWIFDNSGASPAQIAVKAGNTIKLDPAALPEVKAAIDRALMIDIEKASS
ncbi:zeta toxin family protein [Rubrivivax sp. JA1024]|nr:zeta toxin family protein [Rubrivivax sp. JA1024]